MKPENLKAPERERAFAHATDYLKRDNDTSRGRRDMLVHRGFWIHHVPRPLLACRARGHEPVVDGTTGARNYRWVCCDRCGLRTSPQGDLDADDWNIGDAYTGELPGPWPYADGQLGAEVVIGRRNCGVGASVKIGHGGSEHTLAAHVHLGPLGAVYVHTERFGTWLQRRLNPDGYDSRVIEVEANDGRLYWHLWTKRGEWSSMTPKWRHGSTVIDPRDRLLGPLLYSYEQVGDPVTATIRMPEGDDHEVELALRRVRRGRRGGDGKLSWDVRWESEKGILFRRGSWKGDEVTSSGVAVSDSAVEAGRWAEEACAAIAVRVSGMRTRYRWRAPAEGPLGESDDTTSQATKVDA